MNRRGMVAGILIGLSLLVYASYAIYEKNNEQRWVGQEAADRYFAGDQWKQAQFLVNVAGRNAMYDSLVVLGKQGGLSSGDCWDEELKLYAWSEGDCSFTTLDDLAQRYADVYRDALVRHLETQLAHFPYPATFDRDLIVQSFAEASSLTVRVDTALPLRFEVEEYAVEMPLRVRETLRSSLQPYLDVHRHLVSHADCFIAHFEDSDFSSCVNESWQAGRQGNMVVFGIPGIQLASGQDVTLRFAITLNTLKEFQERTSAPESLFGENS